MIQISLLIQISNKTFQEEMPVTNFSSWLIKTTKNLSLLLGLLKAICLHKCKLIWGNVLKKLNLIKIYKLNWKKLKKYTIHVNMLVQW